MWIPNSQGRCSPQPSSAAGRIPTRVEGGRSSPGRRLLAQQWSLPSPWPLAAEASPSLGMGTAECPPACAWAAVSWYCLPRCPGSPVLPAVPDRGQGQWDALCQRLWGAQVLPAAALVHAGCSKVEPGEGILVKPLIGGSGLAGIWSKAVLGKGCGVGEGYSLYGIFKVKQWQTLRDPCEQTMGASLKDEEAGDEGKGWQLADVLG